MESFASMTTRNNCIRAVFDSLIVSNVNRPINAMYIRAIAAMDGDNDFLCFLEDNSYTIR